jgi:uncharacterized protein
VLLRPIEPRDHDVVLALNAAFVDKLSPLDPAGLTALLKLAHRADVVEVAETPDAPGEVAAFAVAIGPGTEYASENYRWFGERYERFLYLDRIAVAEAFRRRGLAGRMYDAMEQAAAVFGRMVCEVNEQPPNLASLAFHERRGYVPVGRRDCGAGKVVVMLAKELG